MWFFQVVKAAFRKVKEQGGATMWSFELLWEVFRLSGSFLFEVSASCVTAGVPLPATVQRGCGNFPGYKETLGLFVGIPSSVATCSMRLLICDNQKGLRRDPGSRKGLVRRLKESTMFTTSYSRVYAVDFRHQRDSQLWGCMSDVVVLWIFFECFERFESEVVWRWFNVKHWWYFLLKTGIFHCYVSLPEGSHFQKIRGFDNTFAYICILHIFNSEHLHPYHGNPNKTGIRWLEVKCKKISMFFTCCSQKLFYPNQKNLPTRNFNCF